MDVDENSDGNVYIERDSLIQMNCKQGQHEPGYYYQILSLFTKYYDKWCIPEEDKLQQKYGIKPNNVCILAQIVLYYGKDFR